MKVYIAVDMEGATGIASAEQCRHGSPYFEEARRLLTNDVNAVVAGALAGGADQVIVADVHNGSFNLILEKLTGKIQVIYGVPGRAPRFPELTSDTDALFLVAYHAKAGTPHAVLEHTMSSRTIQRQWINGTEVGEVGIDAAIAGCAGVPVVFVSGDDKVCAEARELLGPIETVAVKKGIDRQRAVCLPPKETRDMLFQGAKNALNRIPQVTPLDLGSPVEVTIEYKFTSDVDGVDLTNPRIKRLDGYTVQYTYDTVADWYGGLAEDAPQS